MLSNKETTGPAATRPTEPSHHLKHTVFPRFVNFFSRYRSPYQRSPIDRLGTEHSKRLSCLPIIIRMLTTLHTELKKYIDDSKCPKTSPYYNNAIKTLIENNSVIETLAKKLRESPFPLVTAISTTKYLVKTGLTLLKMDLEPAQQAAMTELSYAYLCEAAESPAEIEAETAIILDFLCKIIAFLHEQAINSFYKSFSNDVELMQTLNLAGAEIKAQNTTLEQHYPTLFAPEKERNSTFISDATAILNPSAAKLLSKEKAPKIGITATATQAAPHP